MNHEKLELLMPAGDMEKLKYAFAYGADAVYVGVPMFSLRARTNSFTYPTLEEAVKYAHDRGKKIYFTANIYPHNVKIKPFLAHFKKMYEIGPDAFIMADPGLIDIVRQEYPDAVIHLSVQQNNLNWAQAKFWKKMGVERMILSRELSLKEMAEIHKEVPDIELEAFIHGAICIAYSGRCLMSNYFSNRDPNQGVCSHSCRWEYKVFKGENDDEKNEDLQDNKKYIPIDGNFYLEEKKQPGKMLPIDEDQYGTYLMNSRDMCTIDYMPELVDSGVISFKVEGRNKTINYIAGVGKAYRAVLDFLEKWREEKGNLDGVDENSEYKKIKETAFQFAFSVANRGYIPGFLSGDPGHNAQFYEKNGGFSETDYIGAIREYDAEKKRARVEVKNRFTVGEIFEIITPDEFWEEKISSIFHVEKGEVSEAHGGAKDVWIPLEKNPGEFAVLQRRK